MSKALVVLGMHRSGTSALLRVCNLLGVYLSEHLLPPNPGNPLGHWEHRKILHIHNRLLRDLGSSWDDVRPLPPGWADSQASIRAREQIIAVLKEDFLDIPVWGLKDPRTCRLLPLWLPIFAELGCQPHFLIAARHPAEVAASLKVRDAISDHKSYLLWLRYTIEMERWSRAHKRVVVTYDDLLSDWTATMARAFSNLGLECSNLSEAEHAVDSFLKSSLRHHNLAGKQIEADSPLMAKVCSAYAALKDIGDQESNQNESVFDELGAEMENADTFYATVLSQYAGLHQKIATFEKAAGLRNQRVFVLRSKVVALEQQIECLTARLVASQEQICAIHESRSWRMTLPLRNITIGFRRSLSRKHNPD